MALASLTAAAAYQRQSSAAAWRKPGGIKRLASRHREMSASGVMASASAWRFFSAGENINGVSVALGSYQRNGGNGGVK
jgi:hypothetical protein